MRAIVPGYQSAAAIAGRGARRASRENGRRRRRTAVMIIIITIIQYNHSSIYGRQNAAAANWSNFFTRLPYLPRFLGNWNRHFRAFSAIFLNTLTGSHAADPLRSVAVARPGVDAPGKASQPASHPATRTHRSYRHRLYSRSAIARFPRPREVASFPVVVFHTHTHTSEKSRFYEMIMMYTMT